MKTKKSPYKIVYILGSAHCGSTLIDMAIGASQKAFSMGELAFYSHYIKQIPHKKIDEKQGFVCTCKKQVSDCPFWKSVNTNVSEKNPIIKNRGQLGTYKIFLNILNPLSDRFQFPVKVGKNKKILDAVYNKATSQKPDLNYLIDSSKDPRRLLELVKDKNIPNKNIYVLYLVRDGRAYLNSYKKDVKEISGVKPRNIIVTMFEWLGVHIACRAIIKKHKLKHRVVGYHDFAQNPQIFFKEIFRFLNIQTDYKTDYLLKIINNSIYHNLHGNLVKFKKFEKITHDDSWKSSLSWFEKLVSTLILFPFNKSWVFNNKSSRHSLFK